MSVSVTFVLCIENNAIRAQALLLCESIRQFGGPHKHAPILAIAPRPGLGIDPATQRQLEAMGVTYTEAPLNVACPEYGSANRVFAAAWAETRVDTEWIVVLDSDTIVLDGLELPDEADVAVRPVDAKGTATEGPGDPFEDYWRELAALQDVPLESLPYFQTTMSGHRVRASYNGGLVAVRRERGILNAWAALFARSVAAGLKPLRGSGIDIHASTGPVGRDASEYWGSNQAALSFAIWSKTTRVVEYPGNYNVPLHLMAAHPQRLADRRPSPLVHVHYHWLFTDPYSRQARALLALLGVDRDRLDWLAQRLPIA